jgi:glycosyltransferase involved in cell wall biosynthesis
LDRFCITNADYIWDVSPAMLPARIKAGLDPKKIKPIIEVPNALFPFQIDYDPINKLKKDSLLFVGTIGPENGLDLAVESLSLVRKKIPSVTLDIIGSGLEKEERRVKEMIKKLKLEKAVKFHGFVSDLEKLAKISKQFMVGLAPYRAIDSSVRWYADATKMRLYFANGLPVITTQVPPLGIEVEKKGCAIVVKDEPKQYADAIFKMLKNRKDYEKYRNAAINFAKENTWENTYNNALKKMGLS